MSSDGDRSPAGVPRHPVDRFYRAWLGRDLRGLAEILDEDVRWSSPVTLPGGGVRRGRRSVLEQAALVFARFPSVVVERMQTTVVGDFVTVRGSYRTLQGRRMDFVDHIHVRNGRVVALRGSMRPEQVRGVTREPARR
jgi:ketosteroid isomerase-like protein